MASLPLDGRVSEEDYKKYLPADPTHPRSFIPLYVRYAKRALVGFRCPITGWKETDWYRDKQGRGSFRFVGRLTIDHILAGANGGLTTDENIRAISMIANSKRGSRTVSDEELGNAILTAYERVDPPEELVDLHKKYGIIEYKVGK